MVKKCIVCNKTWSKSADRSLHRFPKDIFQRQMWLQNLSLQESNIQLKDARVCSNHFGKNDIIENVSGRHVLKHQAMPSINMSEELQERKESDSSYSTDTAPESILNIENMSIVGNIQQNRSSSPISSSTVTASSFDYDFHSRPVKRRKLNKPRYFGDCRSSDMSSPTTAKRNWNIAKTTITNQRKKISALKRKNRQLKSKIQSLSSLLTYLKEYNYISNSAEAVIEGSVPEVIKRLLKGTSHEKYSPVLRTFALTLHFYSPKAYEFVRKTFNSSLPHPRTIRKWYSNIEGKPGFTEKSLRAIQSKVALSNKTVCVNLVVDEMHIMKKVEWTGKEIVGYINLGTKMDSDCVPEATQALVFIVVALNDFWKVPVGYFFIESLSGPEKGNLVLNCLNFLSDCNIKVTSITFDGAPANITMMKFLGANLDNAESLTTYFLHPVTNEQIYFFLDPCHMLKLVRNVFGTENSILKNKNQKVIKWDYLQKLVEIQEREGLLAGTKLKQRHLQWVKEKMRVRIAAQTLSGSVADALTFLDKDLKITDFADCEATVNFILLFNNIFEIFNSKNLFAKYFYKKPITEKNWQNICEYFQYATDYILNLQLNGQMIVTSSKKTGFLGFLVCIESLKCLFWKCVVMDGNLDFILTYKLSQDHLEIFFSAIRSRCGANNNPTCKMFETCYKKLLIHTEVKSTKTANAIVLDGTTILDCSSNITKTIDGDNLEDSDEYINFNNELFDHDYLFGTLYLLNDYIEDVVAYIAGFVVKCLKKKITCKPCISLLEGKSSLSKLQNQKTYGKLQIASAFVVSLCKYAEQAFKTNFNTTDNNNRKNMINKLISFTLRYLPHSIFDVFSHHTFDYVIIP